MHQAVKKKESTVHILWQVIQSLDVTISNAVGSLAGNYYLDRLVSHMEANSLFKAGIFIAAYWYFWFLPGSDQRRNRKAIITVLAGTVLAIVLARVLAGSLPFRIRPIYDARVQHHLSLAVSGFEDWSSFPSDTVAYVCALAAGLIYLSRRLTIPVVVFTAGCVCLPRVYLGIHFASDVLVGAALAFFSVWAAFRIDGLWPSVTSRFLDAVESKPHLFYAGGFLASYEMAVIFADIRPHVFSGLLRLVPHHSSGHLTQLVLALLVAAAIGAYVGVTSSRRTV
jgi:membrane-associated phospholipid phosphatase